MISTMYTILQRHHQWVVTAEIMSPVLLAFVHSAIGVTIASMPSVACRIAAISKPCIQQAKSISCAALASRETFRAIRLLYVLSLIFDC